MKKYFKFIWLFLKASNKDKKDVIEYLYKKTKQRIIDYWFGHVTIIKQHIADIDGKEKLYTISIIAGRRGKGAWFSDIYANNISKIIQALQECNIKNKKYQLHVDYGGGGYLNYVFNKYQQKLLLRELVNIIDNETIYKG